jgi:hypothetical protein
VATSEAVVSFAGPASGNGSLATIRLALSNVKIKTLLKPPSIFLQAVMVFAPEQRSMILWQRALKLNLM